MLVVLLPAPLISEAITNGKIIFNEIPWEFNFGISNTSSLLHNELKHGGKKIKSIFGETMHCILPQKAKINVF